MISINVKRRQAGDTIVEVLIAIAVVGSVLAIAYSIMNRNLIVMRDNQERTESVKLAQAQIESLKSIWGTAAGRAQLNTQGANGFCLSGDGNNPIVDLSGGAPTATMESDNFGDYAAECINQGIFHIGIRRQGSSPNYTYRVTVRWDQVGTRNRKEAAIVYRLN